MPMLKNTSSKVIRDCIPILSMNCQIIKHKKGEIAVIIDSSESDVLRFMQTLLHPSMKNNEFLTDTYEVHRRDRPTDAHGGVPLAIKKDPNSHDVSWTKGANHVAPGTEILFQDLSLEQMVRFPTRCSGTLDIILGTRPILINRVESMPGISDHDIMIFINTSIKPLSSAQKYHYVEKCRHG